MILEQLEVKNFKEVMSSEEIVKYIEKLVDYIQETTKTLNYVLGNLSSDNIAEVDFGRTRLMNISKMNNGLATKAWVVDNFVHK